MNKNLFNSIKLSKPKKSVFDLTHDVKFSMDMGPLYPICVCEAVPGDKFTIGCESLIRFAPMIAPVMHRFDATMHYFFVPNRLLWPNWEKWIIDPSGEIEAPWIEFGPGGFNNAIGSLADYMGIPAGTANLQRVSALPFAAYRKIYDEYYRDQNLIEETFIELTDGDNMANSALAVISRRAWEHDYFTSALPFAQKGDPVNIPIGELQDVEVVRDSNVNTDNNVWASTDQPSGTGTNTRVTNEDVTDGGNTQFLYAKTSDLDLGSTTINDLRRAFRLQEWLEKNARAGTRYIESILAHFGVRTSDKRLQRPEYITGIKTPVTISEVLNNTGESGGLPQGNMSGHGVGVVSGRYGSYFCEEHGFIIGIMSVLPKPCYQQGIPKQFLKFQDPFQHYWPTFAHIGEQEVLNKELYADHTTPDGTFGYVPRYAEYKYMPSRVAGDFRESLAYWHLGRIFDTDPELNQDFIQCNPGKRIFAVESTDDSLYVHVLNKIKAVRPMPYYGTPMF